MIRGQIKLRIINRLIDVAAFGEFEILLNVSPAFFYSGLNAKPNLSLGITSKFSICVYP